MSNPIISHVRLMVAITEKAPDALVEKWALGLKTYAEIINQRRESRIPDETKFLERLAYPASQAYQGVINPDFISRADKEATDITTDQGANLRRSYKKHDGKLDHAFGTVNGIPAKRFIEAVERAKSDYAEGMAQRGLPFTGSYLYGLGPAAIASLWLVNDPTVLDALRAGDKVLEGGPKRICRVTSKAGFKSALTQRLIQAGAQILKATLSEDVRKKQNDRINALVQGFVDPALGLKPFARGAESHVDYIVENEALYLDVQVSTV